MGHVTSDKQVVEHHLECDQCGHEETIPIPITDGEFAPEDWGWLSFWDPFQDSTTVVFHTQRCAVGYFRNAVKIAVKAAASGEPPPVNVDSHRITPVEEPIR